MSMVRAVLKWWKLYVAVLLPFLLLPIPLVYQYSEVKCAYILLLMAVFWMFEILPLAVTALLPIVLVPLFGIVEAKKVAPNYMKDTNMLFLGGLMMAICIENWSLHKRIALKVLQLVGTKPRWLMLGFMLPTWFLSMWISNTATTAMMVPIVGAVLQQIKIGSEKRSLKYQNSVVLSDFPESTENTGCINEAVVPAEGLTRIETAKEELASSPESVTPSLSTSRHSINTHASTPSLGHSVTNSQANIVTESTLTSDNTSDTEDAEYKSLCKAMFLCIAYAANAGGISTLTGTPPNLVLTGQLGVLFKGDTGINFTTWMAFALPVSFIVLILCWTWLQIYFIGCKATCTGCFNCKTTENDMKVKAVIQEEYRRLGKMTWAQLTSLIFFITLAALWLTRSPKFMPGWGDAFLNADGKSYVSDSTAAILISVILFIIPSEVPSCDPSKPVPPSLLDWETLTHKMPWNILILLGGGFAIADASQKSGLSEWIGLKLAGLSALPIWVMVLIITTIIAMLTEVTSNTATATLMLPILAEMALAGIVMNIFAIFTVTLGVCTWGRSLFTLDVYPPWAAQIANVTTLAPKVTLPTNLTTP
ncbi:solute carrier family 13 member 2-like isoform X2 [Tubulanus polymorphus]|uniref:solute carrier family 13 member 2-like isoform X2 n=1 Tax=Tubulanus polymorphus TaxID=672921 RepID=UPI003DA587AD